MFKIQNIFLLIFLTTILTQIHARGGSGGRVGRHVSTPARGGRTYLRGYKTRGSVNENEPTYREQLIEAMASNPEKVKWIVEKEVVDLNEAPRGNIGLSVFGNAISDAMYDPKEFSLELVKFLLEHGADANRFSKYGSVDYTPLEQVIGGNRENDNYFKLIKILLNRGAKITDRALSLVKYNKDHDKIIRLFDHVKLLHEAGTRLTQQN